MGMGKACDYEGDLPCAPDYTDNLPCPNKKIRLPPHICKMAKLMVH